MQVILNSQSGESGDISQWVARFSELWSGGAENSEQFPDLLSPEIKLIAPGLRVTKGRDAGLKAFRKTFEVLPDLTAQVLRWSAREDVLFIEMTFSATIGGKVTRWHNVDRFIFDKGLAVERVAYFSPNKLRWALAANPRGWKQLAKLLTSGL